MANPSDVDARMAMNQVLLDLKLSKTQPDSEDEEYSTNKPAKPGSEQPTSNGQPPTNGTGDAASDTSGSDAGASSPLPAASSASSSAVSSSTTSPQPSIRRPAKPVDPKPLPQAVNTMNNCIDNIRASGRSTLHANEDPLATMQFTSEKPRELENIMKVLGIRQDRVAHEQHRKYVLLREGFTSYVYLAKCQSVQ